MNKQITEALEQIRDDVKWNSNECLVDVVINYISKLQKEFKDVELAYGLYKDRYETLQKENEELKEDNEKQWEERCRLTFKVSELQSENETLKEIVNKNHETMLDKRYVEMNFVSKDKIKETKEKVHWLLDKNGITRAYQLEIDRYFEELLKENNNE